MVFIEGKVTVLNESRNGGIAQSYAKKRPKINHEISPGRNFGKLRYVAHG